MAKGKKTFYNIIIAICVVVFCVCAFLLVRELLQYKNGRDEYNELAEQIVIDEGENPLEREIDWEELQRINPDTLGWIYLPGTMIDYPVVQGVDNEHYLTHTFSENDNKLGAIFMDYANSPEMTDDNTIVYGHHMRDGSMFKTLVEYKSQDYYGGHTTFYYYTPDKVYECLVFSSFISEAEDPYTTLIMADQKESLFQQYQARSQIATDVILNPDTDRILTLSTCDYDFEDARYVVQCKLIDRTEDR